MDIYGLKTENETEEFYSVSSYGGTRFFVAMVKNGKDSNIPIQLNKVKSLQFPLRNITEKHLLISKTYGHFVDMQEYSRSYHSSFVEMAPDYDTDDESSCIYEELPAQRWKEKVTSLVSVKSGDAVCFKRTGGLYKHHALVSAVKPGKERLKIIVLSGDSIECRKDGLHSVNVARIFIEEGLPNDYHLKKFNCEHFVSYCITGIPFSKQTRSTNTEAERLFDKS
ncbi:unnamed protein product [Mytilus edulis]|uniref:LRAT domain-containing protein n=1 Tax=Mytilus edulis TaxID=6550 RepID=A0A8S3SU51_MYTED|nr:unnamed protein product [Mytilus edulis]